MVANDAKDAKVPHAVPWSRPPWTIFAKPARRGRPIDAIAISQPSYIGAADADARVLVRKGYVALPEDLGMFGMDAGTRLWYRRGRDIDSLKNERAARTQALEAEAAGATAAPVRHTAGGGGGGGGDKGAPRVGQGAGRDGGRAAASGSVDGGGTLALLTSADPQAGRGGGTRGEGFGGGIGGDGSDGGGGVVVGSVGGAGEAGAGATSLDKLSKEAASGMGLDADGLEEAKRVVHRVGLDDKQIYKLYKIFKGLTRVAGKAHVEFSELLCFLGLENGCGDLGHFATVLFDLLCRRRVEGEGGGGGGGGGGGRGGGDGHGASAAEKKEKRRKDKKARRMTNQIRGGSGTNTSTSTAGESPMMPPSSGDSLASPTSTLPPSLAADGAMMHFGNMLQLVCTYCLFATDEILKIAFNEFDHDRSGSVGLAEVKQMVHR
jgi:hypothetical protein